MSPGLLVWLKYEFLKLDLADSWSTLGYVNTLNLPIMHCDDEDNYDYMIMMMMKKKVMILIMIKNSKK